MTRSPDHPITRSGSHWHAVAAGFLGWTLDAFDFFVVVFLVDTLALHFGVAKSAIIATIGATLVMRPVGALLFGLLADRFGRRAPLMGNVILFSVLALLCGFSTNYMMFLVAALALRHCDGRRVGRGRVARHGSRASALARRAQRHPAIGILHRLPARRRRRAPHPAQRRPQCLALDVLDRRHPRAARALHPHARARIGSVEAAQGAQLRRRARHRRPPLE